MILFNAGYGNGYKDAQQACTKINLEQPNGPEAPTTPSEYLPENEVVSIDDSIPVIPSPSKYIETPDSDITITDFVSDDESRVVKVTDEVSTIDDTVTTTIEDHVEYPDGPVDTITTSVSDDVSTTID